MKSNEVKEQAEKRKSCPKKYKFLLCEYRISKIYKNRGRISAKSAKSEYDNNISYLQIIKTIFYSIFHFKAF